MPDDDVRKWIRAIRLRLEREQSAAAEKMQASEAWATYKRESAEAFARFDEAMCAAVTPCPVDATAGKGQA